MKKSIILFAILILALALAVITDKKTETTVGEGFMAEVENQDGLLSKDLALEEINTAK